MNADSHFTRDMRNTLDQRVFGWLASMLLVVCAAVAAYYAIEFALKYH